MVKNKTYKAEVFNYDTPQIVSVPNAEDLLEKYKDFLKNKNDTNYYCFLKPFLAGFSLLPDNLGLEFMPASANETWLKTYEDKIKQVYNDKTTDCYKVFNTLSGFGVDKEVYSTVLPWAILEPSNYGQFTNIKASKEGYLKRYNDCCGTDV